MKKFKEAGDSQYIYLNKPDKACFQDDMTYGDFINLTIAKNRKFDGYRRGLAPMVFKFFDKKTSGRTVKNKNM